MTFAAQHVRAALNQLRLADPLWRQIIRQVGPFTQRPEPQPIVWATRFLHCRSWPEMLAAPLLPGSMSAWLQAVEPSTQVKVSLPMEVMDTWLAAGVSPTQIEFAVETARRWADGRLLPLRKTSPLKSKNHQKYCDSLRVDHGGRTSEVPKSLDDADASVDGHDPNRPVPPRSADLTASSTVPYRRSSPGAGGEVSHPPLEQPLPYCSVILEWGRWFEANASPLLERFRFQVAGDLDAWPTGDRWLHALVDSMSFKRCSQASVGTLVQGWEPYRSIAAWYLERFGTMAPTSAEATDLSQS